MKHFFITASMLFVCSLANAQCGHFILKDSKLFKATQNSVVNNINDMWVYELIAENVKSYESHSTFQYWRCSVLVLNTSGELYRYTQYGKVVELVATKVSSFYRSGNMFIISYDDGSSSWESAN